MSKDLNISAITLSQRRSTWTKALASGALGRVVGQHELIRAAKQYQHEAEAHRKSMLKLAELLWKSEALGSTLGKHPSTESTLSDHRIPRECFPSLHTGFGAATAVQTSFDVAKLRHMAEFACEPRYSLFAYEGVGAELRLCEPKERKMWGSFAALLPQRVPMVADRQGFYYRFFEGFQPAEQRAIAHGYGRMMAYTQASIYKAIGEALEVSPSLGVSVVHGVGFGFGIENGDEMPRLLEASVVPHHNAVRAAFQSGLVYSLLFCDWLVPGLLADWKPVGVLEGKLIEKARDEAMRNQRRGWPLAFALEDPII